MSYRYAFYIDGINLFYAFTNSGRLGPKGKQTLKYQDGPYLKYSWLNYLTLVHSLIRAKDQVTGIFYFAAFPGWLPESSSRQRKYACVLRALGIEIIPGRFHEKEVLCHNCKRWYITHEEKQTDVKIALKLLGDAVDDLYDRAVIISADSDLRPAIKAVHERFADRSTEAKPKEVGVMFPIGRRSDALLEVASFRFKMKARLLAKHQLQDSVPVGGKTITRPSEWR